MYSPQAALGRFGQFVVDVVIEIITILLILLIGRILLIIIRPFLNLFKNLLEIIKSEIDKSELKQVKKGQHGDFKGSDEINKKLSEIVNFLNNPAKYEDMQAKFPNGILLIGPPGTGKTLFARSIAARINVPFEEVSATDLLSHYAFKSAHLIQDMFKNARNKAKGGPYLLFIDEIDTICNSRTEDNKFNSSNNYVSIVNQLLTSMSAPENEKIIVMGTTNRIEAMDKALLRSGRFSEKIVFKLPDILGRKDILDTHFKQGEKNKSQDYSSTLQSIAEQTDGFSGADLKELINRAARQAVEMNKKYITIEDLNDALSVALSAKESEKMLSSENSNLDKILSIIGDKSKKNGIEPDLEKKVLIMDENERQLPDLEKKVLIMDENERQLVAYREAGRALVQLYFWPDRNFTGQITIRLGNNPAYAYSRIISQLKQSSVSKRELEQELVVASTRLAVEVLMFGNEGITTGVCLDIMDATQIAASMVLEMGMGETGLPIQNFNLFLENSQERKEMQRKEIDKFIERAYEQAIELIKGFGMELDMIAKILIERETLSYEECRNLLNKKIVTNVNSNYSSPSPSPSDGPVSSPNLLV